MLSNDTLNLALSIYKSLTSGTFEGWRELVQDGKNEFFIDGMLYSGKALLIENAKGSLELLRIPTHIRTTIDFNAPCYLVSSNGTLFNIKQKQGFEPKISKIKDSLKADFCKAANLDEKLIELLTNTKPQPKLEFVKVSEGYNLEGLPSSCQSGKGHRFECIDNMAKMALLRIGSRIAARAIVWNNGIIFNNATDEYLNTRWADKLYYGDSDDRIAFVKALEAEGISLLWGKQNNTLKPDTEGFYVKAPKGIHNIAWLDTFSMLRGDNLYCYDWSNKGYQDDNLKELYSDYGFERAFLNVDELGGTDLEALSDDDKVYSSYYNEDIDEEDAEYSSYEDSYIYRDEAVYSNYLSDYIHQNNALWSTIEDDYIGERTFEHDSGIAKDIETNQWVFTDNPNYVPYADMEFKRIHIDNAAYIAYDDEYIHIDDAIFIDEIDEYVPTSWSARDLKDRLADCMSDWTDELLDELVEKYGF
ncbi:hypothetical protein [Campylobacter concisus]|uniref:hypothetical protein n=1 Tax=Campylobacter concisus TaxID=199 RepID=UPI000D334289|nr:hypothetical protein [Campylobacter concisus]QPH88680.1 hypothetical protein CVT15_08210 [Campylobacter concisus]